METFEQLLEEYLDFEFFEDKEDDFDIYEKSEILARTESPFTIDDAISITKFVTTFLGYQMDCSNLYHCGLRELGLDNVIGVDNNFANKNIEYVKKGFLIIVIDAKGKRGTYLNPVYIQKYLEKDDVEDLYNAFHKLQAIELKKINDYYEKFRQAKIAYEEIERFTQLLKETHKEGKVKRLERRYKND